MAMHRRSPACAVVPAYARTWVLLLVWPAGRAPCCGPPALLSPVLSPVNASALCGTMAGRGYAMAGRWLRTCAWLGEREGGCIARSVRARADCALQVADGCIKIILRRCIAAQSACASGLHATWSAAIVRLQQSGWGA